MRATFAEIQRNLTEIANRQTYATDVLYELMAAYGRSASSITKLRSGVINLSQNKETTILQRGVVYFKNVTKSDSLPSEVEKLEQDPLNARYNPRFLIATDLTSFAAKDTKKGNTLEIKWENIDRYVDFFYGWTGDEVVDEKTEAAADRRAADKMKELYFEVEKVNADRLAEKSSNFRHELNVFFTRLLFCFFAEDTRVFSNEDKSLFTSSIREFTQIDGRDLDQFLGTLFEALDTKEKNSYTSPFSNFPYVNGSLFDETKGIAIPKFNAQARKLILDCGALSWAEINPDIFGSMFQSIVDDSLRETHGMHYTSVPNIMKTIEPLFLDELREEFDKNYENDKKLQQLWDRISKIKVFDPACGSGNFLIIAYKELRKLEHAIIDRIFEEDYKKAALAGKLTSRIDLNNFYGIEIDDFACEVAILSLYIAKHQMNIEFEKQFGKRIELIPLDDKANIVKANAARIDWQDVCPNKAHHEGASELKQAKLIEDEFEQPELIKSESRKQSWDEIYLISNPPYSGSTQQDNDQKKDMDHVFINYDSYKNLDYVAIWIEKGRQYIENSITKLAFITTSSICQGEQVGLLWSKILTNNIEISYAYRPFKWSNLASNNAGVACIVVSLAYKSSIRRKRIFKDNISHEVKNISPYLSEGPNIIVFKSNNPISDIPIMSYGNKPVDGGNLILSNEEKVNLLNKCPEAEKFIRRFVGADEFINDKKRWCLWITDALLDEALEISEIRSRIDRTREVRIASKDIGAQKLAQKSHQFRDFYETQQNSIIFPQTSSERREYVPVGLLSDDVIVSNAARVVFGAPLWLFSILVSKMHNVWLQAVAGRLETRVQYSNSLCYNTFPLRNLIDNEKTQLAISSREILLTRENHAGKTLAEMYDPDEMPDDLREAHHQNDILVDRLYRLKPYENDEERLTDLFALYEKMTAEEKNK